MNVWKSLFLRSDETFESTFLGLPLTFFTVPGHVYWLPGIILIQQFESLPFQFIIIRVVKGSYSDIVYWRWFLGCRLIFDVMLIFACRTKVLRWYLKRWKIRAKPGLVSVPWYCGITICLPTAITSSMHWQWTDHWRHWTWATMTWGMKAWRCWKTGFSRTKASLDWDSALPELTP